MLRMAIANIKGKDRVLLFAGVTCIVIRPFDGKIHTYLLYRLLTYV